MPVHFERAADHADAAIHHVGRRDNVGTGICLINRLIDQHRHGIVVQDIARVVDQPVLPMRGIRVERYVGQHADLIAMRGLDGADGLAHQIVGVQRFGSVVAAFVAGRIRKQGNARNAQSNRFTSALDDPVYRPARYAG